MLKLVEIKNIINLKINAKSSAKRNVSIFIAKWKKENFFFYRMYYLEHYLVDLNPDNILF